jgi:catechol 2,3-dioxygenase-like lactoylglutathione lyase family enzyme
VQLHHATLFVRDAEASTVFYRDGLGLAVLVDREFDGDWPVLLGVTGDRLRAIILGDPANPQVGQIELVTFAKPVPDGPPVAAPATATVLLSFQVHLDEALPKLVKLGATDQRIITLSNGYRAASVRDPDGILLELINVVRDPRPA